jgi:hypothetical protein
VAILHLVSTKNDYVRGQLFLGFVSIWYGHDMASAAVAIFAKTQNLIG